MNDLTTSASAVARSLRSHGSGSVGVLMGDLVRRLLHPCPPRPVAGLRRDRPPFVGRSRRGPDPVRRRTPAPSVTDGGIREMILLPPERRLRPG
ncbi:hypothetical protein ACRAWD_06550 [Caulobacter segnis]